MENKLICGPEFWEELEKLVAGSVIEIDCPAGTPHHKYPQMIMPLDYGYLKNTRGQDNAEIDIWRGSLSGGSITGIIVTVDTIKRDSEIKVLLNCTAKEMEDAYKFHNEGWQRAFLFKK